MEGRGRAAAGFERFLTQLVVALGVTLLLAQVALKLPGTRQLLTWAAGPESAVLGQTPGSTLAGSEDAFVTLMLVAGHPPQAAWLLVNGRREAGFAAGWLEVQVADGDLLEIDGTGLSGEGRFQVIAASDRIETPRVGTVVSTWGGVASLGRVRFSTGGDR